MHSYVQFVSCSIRASLRLSGSVGGGLGGLGLILKVNLESSAPALGVTAFGLGFGFCSGGNRGGVKYSTPVSSGASLQLAVSRWLVSVSRP